MTDRDRNELRDQAAAYAIGALDPEEARAFEALMAESEEVRKAVDEYREVGAMLAHGAPPVQASPDLRERLIARARQERIAPKKTPPSFNTTWLVWAAAAAGLFVGGVQTARISGLADRLAGAEARSDTLALALAEQSETLNQILEPQTTLVVLTATDQRPPGMRLFWNRAANTVVIHAYDLPPAQPGRAYQLWFLDRNGNATPGSTFNADTTGTLLGTFPGPPVQEAFAIAAVTEEPAAGSSQPTTTPILVGQVGDN